MGAARQVLDDDIGGRGVDRTPADSGERTNRTRQIDRTGRKRTDIRHAPDIDRATVGIDATDGCGARNIHREEDSPAHRGWYGHIGHAGARHISK